MISEETRKKMSDAHLKNPTRHWAGKTFSESTKCKMRDARLGHRIPKSVREKISISKKGIPMSAEAKRKLSNARKIINKKLGQGFQCGNIFGKHPNCIRSQFKKGENKGVKNNAWKGGVTAEYLIQRTSLRNEEWRKKVLKRDDYRCKKCRIRGGNMHVHHIRAFCEYPLERFITRNGATLCVPCHRIFHKKYGHKGIGRKQLNQFI